jgi:signal transduction histidine kinase
MESTLRILCLEDSPEDFGLINYHLKKANFEYLTERVESEEDFLKALNESSFDLVLSDHSIPQFNSLEALKKVRLYSPALPFILVTGAVSEEFAVSCLKFGADDYVLKKNLADLPNVIENAVRMRAEEKRKIRMAKDLATRNEELSKLNKELDSFVYSVSHNLRAPLRSILGLLNLSKTEQDRDAINTYHELMEKSIKKLDLNLAEILEYSRNATQDLKIENIDIKAITNDAFEKLMFMPGFNDLHKHVEIDQRTPCFGDAYRLSVIVNNLVSNAVKYKDAKKTMQWLKIVATVEKDQLVFSISDNGIGIDQYQLPKLFKRFSRATDQSEGVGLGLYIVKEAVEILKGEISITSTPGEGTTFNIRIPNYL